MPSQITSIKQAYLLPVGSEVALCGWVRSRRDSKGITFIELNDGSRFRSMQLVVDAGAVPEDTLKQVTTGSSIAASGVLVESPAKGQTVELKVAEVKLYGTADAETYPLQKKGHTLRVPARDRPPARPQRTPSAPIARVRNALTHAIHSFFQERGFLYVHTPIITTQRLRRAPGRCSRSRRSTCKICRACPDGHDRFRQDFFGKPAYLTVSGQLEGEIFALALGKVYTFGPTFRAENSQHAAPPRRVLDGRARDGLLRSRRQHGRWPRSSSSAIIRDVLEQCPEDMAFFNERIDKTVLATLGTSSQKPTSSAVPTPRRSTSSRSRARRSSFPWSGGIDLQSEHERFLTEKNLQEPGDPPRLSADDQAVLHARQRRRQDRAGDGRAGPAGRRDHRRQPARGAARRARTADARSSGSMPEDYWWYLDLRRYGTVPHAGSAWVWSA